MRDVAWEKFRILVAPHEVAGYYGSLVQGIKTLGGRAELVTRDEHAFGYANPSITPPVVKLSRALRQRSLHPRQDRISKVILDALAEGVWTLWALSAIFRYKVFIFGFGDSLLRRNVDLPLLRLLHKRIIVNIAHGSEARPPYMDGGRQFNLTKRDEMVELYTLTREISRRVSFVETYADVVIGAPFSTSQFAHKPFVNAFALGNPVVVNGNRTFPESTKEPTEDVLGQDSRGSTVILHAPSNQDAKGTMELKRVIQDLNQDGGNIELVVVHGKSNQEVLETLGSTDFVVDQLFSDTPLAGFASEAACAGKVSIVGGYGLHGLRRFIPSEMFPVSQVCQPDDLTTAIAGLAGNPERAQQLGAAAREFVEIEWASERVAARYLCLIQDAIPDDWYVNPTEVIYVEGCGQPREVTRRRIRALVENFGVEALCVSHNPELLQALIRFARQTRCASTDE